MSSKYVMIGRQNVSALSIARDAGQAHLGLVASCNLSLVACSGERRPPWGYPGQRALHEENDHTWCPGKFSAWGMLMANLHHDFIRTHVMPCENEKLKGINRSSSEVRLRPIWALSFLMGTAI